MAIGYCFLAIRDHALEINRPAWLKLIGSRKLVKGRWAQWAKDLGVTVDWIDCLNRIVSWPKSVSMIQDHYIPPAKRGRKKKAEQPLEPPPEKLPTKRRVKNATFENVK